MPAKFQINSFNSQARKSICLILRVCTVRGTLLRRMFRHVKHWNTLHQVSEEKVFYIRAIRTFQLFKFRINLLAYYHECHSLIGYATHHLLGDT